MHFFCFFISAMSVFLNSLLKFEWSDTDDTTFDSSLVVVLKKIAIPRSSRSVIRFNQNPGDKIENGDAAAMTSTQHLSDLIYANGKAFATEQDFIPIKFVNLKN